MKSKIVLQDVLTCGERLTAVDATAQLSVALGVDNDSVFKLFPRLKGYQGDVEFKINDDGTFTVTCQNGEIVEQSYLYDPKLGMDQVTHEIKEFDFDFTKLEGSAWESEWVETNIRILEADPLLIGDDKAESAIKNLVKCGYGYFAGRLSALSRVPIQVEVHDAREGFIRLAESGLADDIANLSRVINMPIPINIPEAVILKGFKAAVYNGNPQLVDRLAVLFGVEVPKNIDFDLTRVEEACEDNIWHGLRSRQKSYEGILAIERLRGYFEVTSVQLDSTRVNKLYAEMRKNREGIPDAEVSSYIELVAEITGIEEV